MIDLNAHFFVDNNVREGVTGFRSRRLIHGWLCDEFEARLLERAELGGKKAGESGFHFTLFSMILIKSTNVNHWYCSILS
ncbi:MAG: hypothetical protein WC342_01180 [Methanoregula sp.]|jgi:hypothetical protein